MSKNSITILKPKVRFSDNESCQESIEHNKKKSTLQASGPKIRSIVTLKKPVRIIISKDSLHACNKDVHLKNNRTESASHYDDIAPDMVQNTSHNNVLEIETAKTEIPKVLRNVNDVESIKGTRNILQTEKTMSPQDISKHSIKDIKQEGKENKNIVMKKVISGKNTIKTNRELQKINTVDIDKSKITKQLVPNTTKTTMDRTNKAKMLHVKSTTSAIMPCYKHKTMTKNKGSSIKKTVLRNASDSKVKASVEPGVSHKHQSGSKTNDENKKCIIKSNVGIEQLAEPEYNSIICTVNKLKELKQKKIVTDIDHLPTMQRNILSGKISTALDFPLDETIYKNLVDLTVDDKQLPSTITRTKDPEPRQKDIVPKLSDFFVPEDTKEFCTAVHIKPRVPKIDENWSAYKISDKIFEWKCNLDHI